jgi:hypothetical protein
MNHCCHDMKMTAGLRDGFPVAGLILNYGTRRFAVAARLGGRRTQMITQETQKEKDSQQLP